MHAKGRETTHDRAPGRVGIGKALPFLGQLVPILLSMKEKEVGAERLSEGSAANWKRTGDGELEEEVRRGRRIGNETKGVAPG